MAPEYLNNGLISIKSDIFSLGVIIIELLIGSRDYPQGSEASFKQFIESVRCSSARHEF
jgi:interleukin-1 receptor-associated kinase 1